MNYRRQRRRTSRAAPKERSGDRKDAAGWCESGRQHEGDPIGASLDRWFDGGAFRRLSLGLALAARSPRFGLLLLRGYSPDHMTFRDGMQLPTTT